MSIGRSEMFVACYVLIEMSLGRSFLRLISGDSSAGGHSSETAPMG